MEQLKVSKLNQPLKSKFIWIGLSIISSFIFFHFGLSTFGASWDSPVKIKGDTFDYIDSVERLLNGKDFSFQKTNEDTEFVSNFSDKTQFNKSVYYTFRSPGFAFFYYPLRLFLSKGHALIAFLILQILITSLAKYVISIVGLMISKQKWVFYCIFLTLNITPYFVQYNNLILTESLGFSFFSFTLFFTFKSFNDLNNQHNKSFYINLFLGGLCLAITIMLRPFIAIFLPIIGFSFILKYWKNLKLFLTVSSVYFSSFIIIDGIWVVRNYNYTNQIIPLAGTLEFQDHKHKSLIKIGLSELARIISKDNLRSLARV